MTSIRKLALALCLATFCSFSSAQQIDTTGNLINNNSWSGATYGVDPNDCCTSVSGAGALYDTSTDTIMFSYGLSTLTQTIGLQQALGGTGVQVHGYNYSFDYRLMPNSGIHTDNLTASIWLTTSSGFNTEATHLFLSSQVASSVNDQWNNISGTRNFELPYTDPQSVTMRLEGRDGGFWAGYYGPEVKNISLSVNYSFDPCASDPLYSSSCPGYWEAWFQQYCLFWCSSPSEPEVEVASVNYSVTPSNVSQSVTPEETTTGEVKIDAGGIELSTTGELSVPDGIPEEAKEKKPVDMNLISNIIREATDDSKALAIVNQSIQGSLDENANPDFSMTNETLASISRSSTLSLDALQETVNESNVTQMMQNQREISESFDKEESDNSSVQEKTNQPTIEVKNEDTKETTETVKKDVSPNEAAGDVSIESIAQEPIGFNDYLAKNIQDMQFYKSEEIYKDSETVDNRRALRLLSGASDRLHQEMVNEQYK